MDESLVERLTKAVEERWMPRLLCIGDLVETPGWCPVKEPPWDGILLSSLTAGELLQMPNEEVCQALLTGKPVFLRESGLEYRRYSATASRGLWGMLAAKERQLRQLGVRLWERPAVRKLLTLEDVKALALKGAPLPPNARMTPLAKDFWEGRQ